MGVRGLKGFITMVEGAARGVDVDGARGAGCDPDRLRRAFELLAGWVAEGILPGAAALVARGGRIAGEAYLGLADRGRGRPVDSDTLWGLASVTKPVTATAVTLLVEQGLLSLDEPLATLLPEFLPAPESEFDRRAVTLRHILTHSSGLPGFGPDNLALRRAERPLDDFVRSWVGQPLLFAPGAFHLYSNVGILLAAETVGRALTGGLCREVERPAVDRYHEFVHEAILAPLGMANSSLRPPPACHDRIAWVEGTGQEGERWEMANSAYYRALGIPWGGLFSRPRELVRFVDLFLPSAGGRGRVGSAGPDEPAPRIVAPATAWAMTTVQAAPPDAPPDLAPGLREGIPAVVRPRVEWGLGWQIKGGRRPFESGDLSSPETFGHGGSTGTMVWADPASDLTCMLLTNRAAASGWPVERHRLSLFGNAVAAAVE